MDRRLPEGNPAGPPAVSGGSRWMWALVIVAVVTAIATMAVAVVLPALRADPAGSGATAAPSIPAPPEEVEVLDAAGVEAVLRAVQAGGLDAWTVVTAAGIDTARLPQPLDRTCDPSIPCTVVGVLQGFDPEMGAVAVAERQWIKPVPLAAPELRGPVALRIAASGPLELLGHVDLADGPTGAVDVAGLRELEPAIPDGRVVAVHAWLAGVDAPPCAPVGPAVPPAPAGSAIPPAPFECITPRAFLADEPLVATTLSGRAGFQVRLPDGAVRVQPGAYQEYAVSPASPAGGGGDRSRRGLYLVRMVTADTALCRSCRGWLVVGRLDAPPDAEAAPSPGTP